MWHTFRFWLFSARSPSSGRLIPFLDIFTACTVPDGWMECNVDRATRSRDLFAASQAGSIRCASCAAAAPCSFVPGPGCVMNYGRLDRAMRGEEQGIPQCSICMNDLRGATVAFVFDWLEAIQQKHADLPAASSWI